MANLLSSGRWGQPDDILRIRLLVRVNCAGGRSSGKQRVSGALTIELLQSRIVNRIEKSVNLYLNLMKILIYSHSGPIRMVMQTRSPGQTARPRIAQHARSK
jgi:hypothetical protein